MLMGLLDPESDARNRQINVIFIIVSEVSYGVFYFQEPACRSKHQRFSHLNTPNK